MATSFEVIFLGTAADLDPDEGYGFLFSTTEDNDAENASSLVGTTFGTAGNPLHENQRDLSPVSYTAGDDDAYDMDNYGTNDRFRIDGGSDQTFDAIVVYNATVTYLDGSTGTLTAVVIQDTDGNLYLAPEIENNSDQAVLEAQPIVSLTLDSVENDTSNFAADRYDGNFRGFVDGTSGDDAMGLGYTDADGDVIGTTDDYILGGSGNDTIDDWLGNDTVYAGAGDDVANVSNGDDFYDMGAGDDTVNVWDNAGNNTFEGGDDTDTINFTNWQSSDGVSISGTGDGAGTFSHFSGGTTGSFTGFEVIDGTANNDTIDMSSDTSGMTYYGEAGADSITSGSGNDSIDGGTGNDTLTGGLGSDTLVGGDGDDLLIRDGTDADNVSNVLNGGVGNDTIRLQDGINTNDQIDGGDGIDTFEILPGDDRNLSINMVAGDVSDGTIGSQVFTNIENITSGGGNDTIIGNGVDNVLSGGDGDDNISAGDGNDTLFGGTGDDTLVGGAGADNITGGSGLDILDYSASDGAVTVDLSSGSASGGHATGDTIDQMDGITGSAFDDSLAGFDISGPDYTNVIDGGAGNDTIDGRGSDDTLIGGSGDDSIIGGTGDDFLTGGAGSDIFDYAAGDGDDTISDFNIGNTGTLSDGNSANNDSIDLTGFYDNLQELYADQTDDGILNQSNTTDGKGRTVDYTDNSSFGSGSLTFTGGTGDNSFFTQENTGVVCFARGSPIMTNTGECAVEDLQVGNKVLTADHGYQRILWIGRRKIDGRGKFAPIRFDTGVLGNDRPLSLSPQHRVLVSSKIAQRVSGDSEVLVAAKHLLDCDGVSVAPTKEVEYFHFLFEKHALVFSAGAITESLFTGPEALKAIDAEQRDEVLKLFPELTSNRPSFVPARPLIRGGLGRKIATRHKKNGRELVSAAR